MKAAVAWWKDAARVCEACSDAGARVTNKDARQARCWREHFSGSRKRGDDGQPGVEEWYQRDRAFCKRQGVRTCARARRVNGGE